MGKLGLVSSRNASIVFSVFSLIILFGILTESEAENEGLYVTEWHGRTTRNASYQFQKKWSPFPYMDSAVLLYHPSEFSVLKDRNALAKSNQDSISDISDDRNNTATSILPGFNSLKRLRRSARSVHCKRIQDKANKRGGKGDAHLPIQCLRRKAAENIRKVNLSEQDHTTLVHSLPYKSDEIRSKVLSKPDHERRKITKNYDVYRSKKPKNTDERAFRKHKNKNPDTYDLNALRKTPILRPDKNQVNLKGNARKKVRPGNSKSAFQNAYRKNGKGWRKPNRNFKNRKGQLKYRPYKLNKYKKYRKYGKVQHPRKKIKQKPKVWKNKNWKSNKSFQKNFKNKERDRKNEINANGYEVVSTGINVRKDLNSENRNIHNSASKQMTTENLIASTPNANEKQVLDPDERNLREYDERPVEYDEEDLTENSVSSDPSEKDSYQYRTDYDYNNTPETNKSKASKRISVNNSSSVDNSGFSETNTQQSETEKNADGNFSSDQSENDNDEAIFTSQVSSTANLHKVRDKWDRKNLTGNHLRSVKKNQYNKHKALEYGKNNNANIPLYQNDEYDDNYQSDFRSKISSTTEILKVREKPKRKKLVKNNLRYVKGNQNNKHKPLEYSDEKSFSNTKMTSKLSEKTIRRNDYENEEKESGNFDEEVGSTSILSTLATSAVKRKVTHNYLTQEPSNIADVGSSSTEMEIKLPGKASRGSDENESMEVDYEDEYENDDHSTLSSPVISSVKTHEGPKKSKQKKIAIKNSRKVQKNNDLEQNSGRTLYSSTTESIEEDSISHDESKYLKDNYDEYDESTLSISIPTDTMVKKMITKHVSKSLRKIKNNNEYKEKALSSASDLTTTEHLLTSDHMKTSPSEETLNKRNKNSSGIDEDYEVRNVQWTTSSKTKVKHNYFSNSPEAVSPNNRIKEYDSLNENYDESNSPPTATLKIARIAPKSTTPYLEYRLSKEISKSPEIRPLSPKSYENANDNSEEYPYELNDSEYNSTLETRSKSMSTFASSDNGEELKNFNTFVPSANSSIQDEAISSRSESSTRLGQYRTGVRGKNISLVSIRDDDTEKIKHALLPSTTSESPSSNIKSIHLFERSPETLSEDSDNSYTLETDARSSTQLEPMTTESYNPSSENSSEYTEEEEEVKGRRNSSSLQELKRFLNSLGLAKRNEMR